MNTLRQIYIALRYGEWDCGWGNTMNYKFFGMPWAGVIHTYYDGDWILWYVGPAWVGVRY